MIFFTPAIVKYMENNLNITKPCYGEHIVPVPWPFDILRCHCIIHKQGWVQGELHYPWCPTFVLGQQEKNIWVIFLAETSKDLEIILITTVLSFTNSLSRTSLYFSLKTSFVYSNLFSLAKTVTIRCHIQTSKLVRSPSSACKKAIATA